MSSQFVILPCCHTIKSQDDRNEPSHPFVAPQNCICCCGWGFSTESPQGWSRASRCPEPVNDVNVWTDGGNMSKGNLENKNYSDAAMIVWENSTCPNILGGPWYAPKALITTPPQKKKKKPMIRSIPHLLWVISPVFLHLYVFSSKPKKDGTDTGWHEHY